MTPDTRRRSFWEWAQERVDMVKVHPLYWVLREMLCARLGHKPHPKNPVHCRRCFKVLKDF